MSILSEDEGLAMAGSDLLVVIDPGPLCSLHGVIDSSAETKVLCIPVCISIVDLGNGDVPGITGSYIRLKDILVAVLIDGIFFRNSLIKTILSGCEQVVGVDLLDKACDLLRSVEHYLCIS